MNKINNFVDTINEKHQIGTKWKTQYSLKYVIKSIK